MAGKSVADARAKQREDAKSARGSASVSANATASVAEAHFSALTLLSTSPISSVIDARVLPSMTAANISEYEVSLSMDERPLYASVDWRKDCWTEVAFEATIPTTLPSSTRYSHIDPNHPYLFDSCVSIHISYECTNFISLKPLQSPRVIRGLGGCSVSAVIGTLRAGGARGLWKTPKHTHTLHSRTRAGLSTEEALDARGNA